VVTAEQPADHPHHRGVWCASDHVALLHPGPDGIERYDYCFYVDDVFQGRAPGRIVQTALTLSAQDGSTAEVIQRLDWIGPREWGAPEGRRILQERRVTTVRIDESAHVFDIASEVGPTGDIPVALGPTRHAWFNARIADGIALCGGAAPVDDAGRRGAREIPSSGPAWVDFSGPVGGRAEAGITVQPREPTDQAWFVSDWGVLTVGPIRGHALEIAPGEMARFACRFIAHDGPAPAAHLLGNLGKRDRVMPKIARYSIGSAVHYGVLEDDVLQRLAGTPFDGLALSGETDALSDARLLCPLDAPRVFGVGANYVAHIAEMGMATPIRPMLFMKPGQRGDWTRRGRCSPS
jgi:hypothetical protein